MKEFKHNEIEFFKPERHINLQSLLLEYRKRGLKPLDKDILIQIGGDLPFQNYVTIWQEGNKWKSISLDSGYGGIPSGTRTIDADTWGDRWYFAGIPQ